MAIPGSAFSNPSIHGQWNRSTVYLLDGMVNTDFRTTTYTILPIVDTIQEFKVQSHNDSAEFGMVLGGIVNLVSKSGTNDVHGSAWEFVRNNAFDARNKFNDVNGDGTPKAAAAYHQNEFGGAVGGPLWVPKLYNGRTRPSSTLVTKDGVITRPLTPGIVFQQPQSWEATSRPRPTPFLNRRSMIRRPPLRSAEE